MRPATPQASPDDGDATRRIAAARIGLRWGAGFWMPFLLVALLVLLLPANRAPAAPAAWQIGLWLLATLLVLLVCGRWWATRGLRVGEWTLLVAAIAQGLVLFGAAVLLPFALAMHGEPVAWHAGDTEPTAIVWALCSAWMLLLATLVGWRVRRSALRAGKSFAGAAAVPAEFVPESRPAATKRFAHALFSSIGIPILLAAPFVVVLSLDAQQHHAANALLQTHITDNLEPRITDLKELNRVKGMVITRHQMLRAFEPEAARAADALTTAFALPAGVQLVALRTHGEALALDVRCAAPEAEQGLLQFLAQVGYRDAHVVSRRREGADLIDVLSVEAISSRGYEP